MPTLKAVRADKVTEVPGVRHITLRGVEYTITEVGLDEYDSAMKAAEDEEGNVPFGKLLRAMVMQAVRPLPKTPWKYPVYRTLENIVNEMHFRDLPDEAEPSDETGDEEGKEAVPNV